MLLHLLDVMLRDVIGVLPAVGVGEPLVTIVSCPVGALPLG